MELAAVVRARRMVRSYDPDRPVPVDVLRRALEHAIRAPSAGFTQGWDFLVLHGPGRQAFWSVVTQGAPAEPDPWLTRMQTAPTLVLCLSDPQRYLDRYTEPDKAWTDRAQERWPVPYWDVDTGMAALLVLLTAVDEGLGACFFGVPGPRHADLLAAFGVPAYRRVVGVVSLGHPAPDLRSPSLRRGRRPLAEVVHENAFGVPPRWAMTPDG